MQLCVNNTGFCLLYLYAAQNGGRVIRWARFHLLRAYAWPLYSRDQGLLICLKKGNALFFYPPIKKQAKSRPGWGIRRRLRLPASPRRIYIPRCPDTQQYRTKIFKQKMTPIKIGRKPVNNHGGKAGKGTPGGLLGGKK